MEEEITLNLAPDELCATIEALRDALIRRVRWTVDPTTTRWHRLEYPIAQQTIDHLALAYAKAWMLLQQIEDHLDPEFVAAFTLPNEFWDLTNRITLAGDWANSPVHELGHKDATSCTICSTLSEA